MVAQNHHKEAVLEIKAPHVSAFLLPHMIVECTEQICS